MRFGHFAIEQERNISVKSLLQLVQLRIGTVPNLRLIHHQNGFVAFRIVRDDVDLTETILAVRRWTNPSVCRI